MTTDMQQIRLDSQSTELHRKSPHHFMPLSFCSVALDETELNQEYLSKTYGKDFIDAQCNPTKYLICLTNRLKSLPWSNKPDLIPFNCYLVLIPNEKTNVGVNIDLNIETFELKDLLTSEGKVYRVEELIEILIKLPVEVFKPIDTELSQRKLVKDGTDLQLSDVEFLNKQIQQVHSLAINNSQTTLDDEVYPRPNICPTCCQDMDDLTSMTALKTCGHWLCNNCWKEYLENSIARVKLISCPEFNCTFVVDAGKIYI